MSGYVYLERGIFDHPLFASNQPFSEREAFIWLFTNANFAESRFRHKSAMYSIPRGSHATSYRALAGRWKWSTNRVIRVLKLWENERMIVLETEHGFLSISICNYESYQNRRNADGSVTEHERNSHGTATETNQRNGKERKEGKEIKIPPYPPEFEEFWKLCPKSNCSKSEAYKSYNNAIKSGVTHEELIGGIRKYSEFIAETGSYVQHATTWLNRRGWTVDYEAAIAQRRAVGGSGGKGFTAAGNKLASFYEQEAEREREAATGFGLGQGMCSPETVRQERIGAPDAG